LADGAPFVTSEIVHEDHVVEVEGGKRAEFGLDQC